MASKKTSLFPLKVPFCEGRNWAVAGGMLPFQDLLGVWRARSTQKVAFVSYSTQD